MAPIPAPGTAAHRGTGKARFLFTNRKDLEDQPLQRMHPQIVKTRDGLDLVCYLTLPPGSDSAGKARFKAACPATSATVARGTLPSAKVTLPSGMPALLLTAAVYVTA